MVFHKDEIKRKSFHLLILIYIAAYWFLPFGMMVWGMGILIGIVLIAELIRLRFQKFNDYILKLLGGVHRPEESQKISGLPWTLSGSYLTMMIYPDRVIVLVSMLYLAFGDAAAALVGRKHGRIKLIGGKTLEGSLACFVTCLLVGLYFFDFRTALLGALFMTVIELIPWPLNDNFFLPLLSALFLTYLK